MRQGTNHTQQSREAIAAGALKSWERRRAADLGVAEARKRVFIVLGYAETVLRDRAETDESAALERYIVRELESAYDLLACATIWSRSPDESPPTRISGESIR